MFMKCLFDANPWVSRRISVLEIVFFSQKNVLSSSVFQAYIAP